MVFKSAICSALFCSPVLGLISHIDGGEKMMKVWLVSRAQCAKTPKHSALLFFPSLHPIFAVGVQNLIV